MSTFWWNIHHWLNWRLYNDNFQCSQWWTLLQNDIVVLVVLCTRGFQAKNCDSDSLHYRCSCWGRLVSGPVTGYGVQSNVEDGLRNVTMRDFSIFVIQCPGPLPKSCLYNNPQNLICIIFCWCLFEQDLGLFQTLIFPRQICTKIYKWLAFSASSWSCLFYVKTLKIHVIININAGFYVMFGEFRVLSNFDN